MKIIMPKTKTLIMLAIAVFSSALCGNRFGIAIAQLVFLTFGLRFILSSSNSIGWLLLTMPATIVLTVTDWGIVPGDSIIMAALPWFLTMLVTALAMLVYKVTTKDWRGFTGTLILPCIYSALMYIYGITNVFGTWDQIAYKMYGYQDILQLISITGIWGIGFLAIWAASVLNWVLDHNFDFNKVKRGLAVFLTVILIVVSYGQLRLNTEDTHAKTVKVAGVTLNKSIDSSLDEEYGGWEGLMDSVRAGKIDARAIRPKLDQFSADMFEKTIIAAKGGAKIVFWSEASGYVLKEDEAALIEKGKKVCRDYGIYLGLSSYALYNENENRVDGKYINNHIVFISPKGEVLADSIKKKPVPGPEAESMVRSEEAIPVIQTEYGKVSFAICFDADFQRVIRFGREASLFFLPSKDWDAITPVHSEMASLRAIENGFALVRVASMGQSGAYDKYGRTLATTSDFSTNDGSVMYADIPIAPECTLYELFGDYFPVLSFITFIALALYGFMRNRIGNKVSKASESKG